MSCKTALLGLAIVAWPAIATADVISDEEGACRGKAKGDACEASGKAGTCVDSTCGFNDYSAGTPPKRGERPCLMCAPSPEPAKEATPAKTDAAKTDAAKTDAAKTDAAKTDAAKTETAPAKSGCNIGSLGPASALLGLGLLVLARSRRRSGPR